MTFLIANGPPIVRTSPPEDPAPLGTLSAGGFWPEIDLAKLRADVAIDGVVTAARLEHAATDALANVLDELGPWAMAQQATGYATLASVPADAINGVSVQVRRFERAVYAYAKANITERYADADATGRAERGDAGRRLSADDYRRDGLHALRDILGVSRMTSELI
ncbi:head completion/stabilization protein [Comamonas antarctica]|uniref:Head completion/stabilization protein n=1 Tax=Comamonas antarctica TaxID=2743470 RepID=A0A6N1X2V5_9BURK|nr:head completion/stabilization protein [Comamonas antarctica]QKV52653.1 head completion/stabilization protein [Comamonas antarctica]